MASWTSFGWGFFAGLFVGQVTLVFFLALVRQGTTAEIVASPPLADGYEASVHRESVPVEAT
jgi:hypothetical protein